MALAARQPGVITRGQMRRAGLTEASIRWRVGTGTLELVVTGVYRVAGATRSWEQRLAGACLWGGPAPALPTGPQGLSEVSTVLARERWKSRPRSRTGRGSLSRCIGPRSIRPWSRRSWGFRFTNAFRTVLDLVDDEAPGQPAPRRGPPQGPRLHGGALAIRAPGERAGAARGAPQGAG